MLRLTFALTAALLLAGSATGQADKKSYLIPTPKGWREESMPVPPRFAPDMKWKGTEEIRFAPGMYAPDSASFLSYGFLFWLPPDQKIDRTATEQELLAYFRGLAKAVAPRRIKKEVDVAAFTLKLQDAKETPAKRPSGEAVAGYIGELKWIEPFVTGKPQTLRLDIHTWHCDKHDHNCVFVCASPQPDTAEVWKTLREIRADTTFSDTSNRSVLSATKSGDSVVVESKGGSVTYKVVMDPKIGGDISELNLPADGKIVARELNDIFFLGYHGEEFSLRGWTGRDKFRIACAVDLVSQKADEVVVKVDLVTTGTFKYLPADELGKANFRKTHVSYKDKTLEVKRTYRFKPDRIVIDDEILWVHTDTEMKTFYCTAAFTAGAVQGPARLVNGATTANFEVATSAGRKVPDGIVYPSTAENFLKNGFKVSLRTTAMSFDLGKSDWYFYEKPWQQDWFQVSGFMYRLTGTPAGKPIRTSHELVFSKASVSEMPPVVTIKSPSWDARWLDEKGKVAKFKIGDTMTLSASAVNSDGSPVPGEDISWDIHIDPWWNTPSVTLRGNTPTYTVPGVTNEADIAKSKDRNLLGIFTVKVKGKNGTEAVEPFAVLIGKK
jgi:hypothetical protein